MGVWIAGTGQRVRVRVPAQLDRSLFPDECTVDCGRREGHLCGCNAAHPLALAGIEMMIAQRMFMANLRAAQAADEMLETATELIDE